MIVTTFGELMEYLESQEWKANMPVKVSVCDEYNGGSLEPVEIVIENEMVVFQ